VGPDRVHAGEATGLGLIGRHMEGAIDVARTLRATVVGQAPAVLRMLCSTLGELFCWVGAAGAVYGVQQLGILFQSLQVPLRGVVGGGRCNRSAWSMTGPRAEIGGWIQVIYALCTCGWIIEGAWSVLES